MTSPAATIALGLAVLLLVGRSAPVRAQFFNNLVFRYSTLGDLVHVLQTDATKLYRQTIKKTVDLVACPFGECCVPEFVTGDVQGLLHNFTEDLFGQHIAVDVLTRALGAHYASADAVVSDKPLVLSLHGQSGTGKTFAAQRIAAHLFRRGMRSRFVHHFVGRIAFPLEAQLSVYQQELADRVRLAVQQCSQALFIFDELDKMPAGILDGIASVLNNGESVDGVDYRRATFLFVSNSHGEELADRLRQWQVDEGGLREEVRTVHFEPVLKMIAYNTGGLRGSSVISEDLVDHYVPFLPLEKRHVKQCVRREFRRRGVQVADATEELVNLIATEAATYKDSYSISGCKRIDKSVAYYAVGFQKSGHGTR